VGYSAKPYLFVLDKEGNQFATVRFKGQLVDELKEPSKVRSSNPGAIVVKRFFGGVSILDDKTIIVGIRKKIYILSFAKDVYTASKCLNLEMEEGMIYSLYAIDGKIYVSNGLTKVSRFATKSETGSN
jgi:hypothetical protein